MALYSLKFKTISPITAIPTAQTIFGTICHYYENEYGTKELEILLDKFSNDNPSFIVSSMYLNNLLPIPQNFMPHLEGIKNQEDAALSKKVKKVKYFSKKIFLLYQEDQTKFQNQFYNGLINGNYKINQDGIVMLKDEDCAKSLVKTTRTRVNINKEQFYQDEVIMYETGTIFEFYLDLLDQTLLPKLEALFKKMQYVTFGGHKSIGYNMYNFEEMIEAENIRTKKIGMLLSQAVGDSSIDYHNSYYQINEFNLKFNNAIEKVNRAQIIVFMEGSIIKTDKPYIGKVIKETNNGKTTYQNVLGLLI